MSDESLRELVVGISRAIAKAIDLGEQNVTAHVSRKVPLRDVVSDAPGGVIFHEHVTIEGFVCARPECKRRAHVWVLEPGRRHEFNEPELPEPA